MGIPQSLTVRQNEFVWPSLGWSSEELDKTK